MVLFFLIKNDPKLNFSLIKIEKSTIFKITPIILNEELSLDEICFSGTETTSDIVKYLKKYFNQVIQVIDEDTGTKFLEAYKPKLKLNRSKDKLINNVLLVNLFFPGLGFLITPYKYSGIIFFILIILGYLYYPGLATILYILIIFVSFFKKDFNY